ncbi:alpha/beta fold hydrolase [Arthrobacter sp. KK5.5]|uniref:alpha/beta hydrolase n=1 Tax=Arthrobacter sp. KK5.5 TaxID=3373084 RepID=UPI003EE428D7
MDKVGVDSGGDGREGMDPTADPADMPVPVGTVPPAAELVDGGGFAADSPPGQWTRDPLGPGFRYRTLDQGKDEEGPVRATLVRYLPASDAPDPGPPVARPPRRAVMARAVDGLRRAGGWGAAGTRGTQESPSAGVGPAGSGGCPVRVVLSVHGWTDYFFNAELARYWTARGYRFYALDLRRYGRSLRPWQTPGFVTDLREYDADIEAALEAIHGDVGTSVDVVCVAHSTGGLIASLWADRNPGVLSGLVLNSPWLEMQGSWMVRNAAASLLDPVARRRPRTKLKLPEVDTYWQSLSVEAHGEWKLHPLWRPRHAFPVTVGWMSAVLAGHSTVSKGLDIREPVLVLTSDRSHFGTQFDAGMLVSDAVLEVEVVRQRALKLGREVSVVRIERGMHDLFTSSARARSEAYRAVTRWSDGYLSPSSVG